MKRQGKYGFTFDNKAEEVAYIDYGKALWIGSYTRKMNRQIAEASIKGGVKPDWLRWRDKFDKVRANYVRAISNGIDPARPAQPYAELDAVCTQIARPVPVWPFAAGAAICLTLALVLAEGWI